MRQKRSRVFLALCGSRPRKRTYPVMFPESWPTASVHYSSCTTSRGHLSNSWALVFLCDWICSSQTML